MAFPNLIAKLQKALQRIGVLETNVVTINSSIQTLTTNVNSKATKSHAVNANTYGLGTGSVFGHVKLSDSTSSTSAVGGSIAATPKAVKDAMDKAVAAYNLASSTASGASGYVKLSGGTMTGALKVPTPAAKLNDTTVATTAWVHREMLNIVYPVGSIYMSVNNVSPASFLGGTWAALGGRFLFGVDASHKVNSTGGAATHVISTNELPKHTHKATTSVSGKHAHTRGTLRIRGSITSMDIHEPLTLADQFSATGALTINNKNEPDDVVTTRGYMLDSALKSGGHRNTIELDTNLHSADGWSGKTSEEPAHGHTISVDNTGSSSAMSMMPPYLAVYMWKRTA